MKKLLPPWQFIAAAVAIIVFIAAETALSHSYNACANHDYAQYSAESAKDKSGSIPSLIFHARFFVVSPYDCTVRMIDRHNGFFSALAAIAVGVFTLMLKLSSDRQGRLTEQSIALARAEFSAQHRPWLAIRGCNLSGSLIVDEGRIHVPLIFDIENTGTVHADRCFLFGDAAAGFEQVNADTEITKLINRVEKATRSNLPYEVIFPHEKATHKSLFEVSTVDGDKGDALRRTVYILVYGVFFYESPLDKILRHTSFSYGLYLDPVMLVRDDEGAWPVIPPDKVKIYKYQFGWSAT